MLGVRQEKTHDHFARLKPGLKPLLFNDTAINTGNIATWNVKGLNSDTKRQVVKSLAKSEKIKILCLQETHSSSTNKWQKSLGFRNAFWSHGNTNSRGVAVLWNLTDAQIIKSWKDDNGRIAVVTLQKDDNLFTIGSVYAPNIDLSNNSQRAFNRFLQELEVYVSEARNRNDTIIIAGDLNIIRHPYKDNPSADLNATHPYPLALEMFEDFLVNTNLTDAYRAVHKNQRTYSYAPFGNNYRNIKRRLDYFLCSSTFMNSIGDIKYKWGTISDHKIGIMRNNSQQSIKGPGLWRHNDSLLSDNDYCMQIQNIITQTTNENHSDYRSKWEDIKQKVKEGAIKICKIKAGSEKEEGKEAREIINNESNFSNEEVQEARDTLNRIATREANTIIFRSRAELGRDLLPGVTLALLGVRVLSLV